MTDVPALPEGGYGGGPGHSGGSVRFVSDEYGPSSPVAFVCSYGCKNRVPQAVVQSPSRGVAFVVCLPLIRTPAQMVVVFKTLWLAEKLGTTYKEGAAQSDKQGSVGEGAPARGEAPAIR